MALPAPTPSTMTTSNTCEGSGEAATRATPSENTQLLERQNDEEALPVDLVRQETAHHRQDQGRPELGEDDDAHERRRVREVVGVGTEDHVLHPGADVRGEGAEEDDAEGAVGQGRPGRAAAGRDDGVAVDDGVLDLLEGDRGLADTGAPTSAPVGSMSKSDHVPDGREPVACRSSSGAGG